MATKYLFNNNIHGYEKANIEEFDAKDKREDMLVVVIDKTCDEKLGMYYRVFTDALKNNNRVVLVGVNDDNKSFKPLASLLVTYNEYGIYQIEDKSTLGAVELQKMCERKPDFSEVQTFIGGDVTAYADMSTILFGIESLVNEGNIDQIKDFLNQHMISIESLTSTLNNMKKTCDMFNSDELVAKINSLKSEGDKLRKQIEDDKKALDDVKYDRDKLKVSVEDFKRENEKLKATNNELKQSSDSGGSIIRAYKEINTQLIQCKTKIILYFKEISYVPYVNSLVVSLQQFLEMNHLKHKMLIFDSQTNLYSVYKPLQAVSSVEYLSMKSALISKTKQFVVSEPNPTILQDVLCSDQCFDVIIVYDRLKCTNDLVTGNNVTKFFVINSSKEFDAIKQQLKILDLSNVITHANSSIGLEKGPGRGPGKESKPRQFLDIPYVENYNTKTDVSKTSTYIKMYTAHTQQPLLDTIFKKSRIDTLFKQGK